MRIGTRWEVGSTPPAGLPEELVDAIHEFERQLFGDLHAVTAAAHSFWTLTWLEGRPVCQLDGGPEITIDSNGRVHNGAIPDSESDDWLDA